MKTMLKNYIFSQLKELEILKGHIESIHPAYYRTIKFKFKELKVSIIECKLALLDANCKIY